MNSMVLIKKELRENKWVFIIGLILLLVFALTNSLTYSIVKNLLTTNKVANIPGMSADYLQTLQNFGLYTWSGWFGKSYEQVTIVLAIILGMGLIAGEVSKDTIGFLLAKPFSRRQVFAQKFLAGSLILIVLSFLSTIWLFLTAKYSGNEFNLGLDKFLIATLNSLPSLLLIFSLTIIFSVILNDRLKAGLIAAFIAIALSIPGFFPDYADYNFYKYFVSTNVLNGQGFPWQSFIIITAVTTVLYVIGEQLFKRKQF